jgi:hypothetical protein
VGKLGVFPPGPWDGEIQELSFWIESPTYGAEGYRGHAIRHDTLGHWCGYIDLPADHPWCSADTIHDVRMAGVDVHGGITYVGRSPDTGRVRIGFDCAHAGDLVPGLQKFLPPEYAEYDDASVYRPIEYVVDEIHKLGRAAEEAAT